MTRPLCGLSFLMLAFGCGERTAEEQETRMEPVVVYAAYADEEFLHELFAHFTRDTGIPVTTRYGAVDQNDRDVAGNTVAPPADVLLAATISGLRRAADEGALRPLRSQAVEDSVPEVLRDPDGYWVAIRVELAIMAARPGRAEGVSAYLELADPDFAGKLCLSNSTNPINRSVIAQLIAEHGTRPAELIVRGWMRNLARPPYASEAQLLAAIAAGSCSLGLASKGAARAAGMEISIPVPSVAVIEAVGVARHARNPEAAKRLVEWLVGVDATRNDAEAYGHLAAITEAVDEEIPEIHHPSIAGAYGLDAGKLAERVAWR